VSLAWLGLNIKVQPVRNSVVVFPVPGKGFNFPDTIVDALGPRRREGIVNREIAAMPAQTLLFGRNEVIYDGNICEPEPPRRISRPSRERCRCQ
jgi:hypothetical protein